MSRHNRNRELELNLRTLASQAELLADDVAGGKLWEGDAAKKLANIGKHFEEARRIVDRDPRG